MNNKRTWIEKLGDFISGKGFYLVVLICVAAIALSGYYLVQGVRDGLDSTLDQPVSGSAAIWDTPSAAPSARPSVKPSDPPAAGSAQITAPPAVTASPAPSAALSEAPAASPEPSQAPAALVFTWPVKGAVSAGYAVETLVYSETMGDWRVHSGLDIAAALGTQVLAATDGTVKAVYQDDLMGTVVEIDHGNDLVSQYANLASVPTVKVGDEVSTGTVIGSVGTTAAAEGSQAAHLHFAMYQDGNPVDPAGYLPEQ